MALREPQRNLAGYYTVSALTITLYAWTQLLLKGKGTPLWRYLVSSVVALLVAPSTIALIWNRRDFKK